MENPLFALYRLHQVDAALYELQQRANALDLGKAEAEAARRLEADPDGVLAHSKGLRAEQIGLETEQGTLGSKLQRLEASLYDGSLHSQKDIEAVTAEAVKVREHISQIDDRLLELLDEVDVAAVETKGYADQIAALKATFASKQAAAKAAHAEFQKRYVVVGKGRAELAAEVPASLIALYDLLRKKLGTGVAEVSNERRCMACGIHVPEKAYDEVVHDKVVQCEGCRRIYFRLQQS